MCACNNDRRSLLFTRLCVRARRRTLIRGDRRKGRSSSEAFGPADAPGWWTTRTRPCPPSALNPTVAEHRHACPRHPHSSEVAEPPSPSSAPSTPSAASRPAESHRSRRGAPCDVVRRRRPTLRASRPPRRSATGPTEETDAGACVELVRSIQTHEKIHRICRRRSASAGATRGRGAAAGGADPPPLNNASARSARSSGSSGIVIAVFGVDTAPGVAVGAAAAAAGAPPWPDPPSPTPSLLFRLAPNASAGAAVVGGGGTCGSYAPPAAVGASYASNLRFPLSATSPSPSRRPVDRSDRG